MVENIILKFIQEMKYLENEHFLGVLFYGSYLTGFYHEKSDIDIHVIFDNSNPSHIYRGTKYIDGKKVEYFEKTIGDLYLSVDNDFDYRNIAWLAIVGNSKIIIDKTGEIKKLQNYVKEKYEKPFPKLEGNDAKEYVSILNNRMEKLEQSLENNTPNFISLYYLTIEKIRRFYHAIEGIEKISTSKVYRIYTDEEYRKSYSNYEIPEQEFIDLYLDALTDESTNEEKMQKIKNLFAYATKNIYLPYEYRIKIKSRNLENTRRYNL